MSSRRYPSMPDTRQRRPGVRYAARGAELPGHLHRRAQVRAANLSHHAERADEKARDAFHESHPVRVCHGKRLKREPLVGQVRRARHRRPVAPAIERRSRRCWQSPLRAAPGVTLGPRRSCIAAQRIIAQFSGAGIDTTAFGVGLSLAGTQHADPFAGRAAAAAFGDANPLQFIRRGVRTG